MPQRWFSEVGRALVVLLVAAAIVIIVGGIGVAGVCKLTSINCHLRDSPTELSKTTGSISLPQGFSTEISASGLDTPTAFDFLPDGRILVAEKDGLVKIVDEGVVDLTPVLDLRERMSVVSFRGLVEVAVDPDFDKNHFIYIVYTPKRNGVARDSKDPTHVLVSRFTLSGVTAGDERVILGADGEAGGTCSTLPRTADCLPSAGDHIGADIAFARDGTLFISTGDGGGFEVPEKLAFGAQDANVLGGKILRVTRDGNGMASNPFYDGDPTSNRSKVWALGLRNPFRLTGSPASNLLYVGDVGERTADEIDAVRAGVNLGWPCYEGRARAPEYKATSRCSAMYRRGEEVVPPTIELHNPGSISVTGGDFVTGDKYPEAYRAYFYADWVGSWIRYARIDPKSGDLRGEPSDFAKNAGGPVSLRIGPDGLLYLLSLNYGELYRVTYAR